METSTKTDVNIPKIKVCGMKYTGNINQIKELKPDYMGFIFHDKSPRNFEGSLPRIASSITRVGVFVDQEVEEITAKVKRYHLNAIQLHGEEGPSYCKYLYEQDLEIIKVFSIDQEFDFSVLTPFEDCVDYFLFDTKGIHKGGNGTKFNWKVFENYTSEVPFILSGGIGMEEIPEVKKLLASDLPIYALDINSRFEIEPGVKETEKVEKFFKQIRSK